MGVLSAEDFIEEWKTQRTITKPSLETIFDNVIFKQTEGIEILDVGCGPGNMVHHFVMPRIPPLYKQFIGVDIDEEYVKYANRHYGSSRVVFQKMDIEAGVPPEYIGRFDLVTSFYVIHLLKDRDKAIQTLASCVKPEGNLILFYEVHKMFDDFLFQMSQHPDWAPYVRQRGITFNQLYDVERNLSVYLHLLGFIVVHCSFGPQINIVDRNEHVENLGNYAFSHTNMPMQKRRECLTYIINNYVNEGMTPEQIQKGKVTCTQTNIMIHARKLAL